MKLLTVVVPSYNAQDYLDRCLESLLPGGERVEIIIVDDGSKDRTGEIADAYAERYPSIVRVIHQENGGHGAGINQGVRHATGKYFKNVDSDDTLSGGFPAFLDELERVDREGGVDIFFTNYYYVHTDGVGDRSINLSNAFPENRVFTWADTKSFRVDQVLMLHTCTFSTQMLRDTGIELPLHMFYEDNYMVYGNLKNAERMYYINTDLYRYTIGREGQSMAEESMKKRYTHQLKAAELCFTSFHLDDVPDRRKRKYLSHELFILLGGAIFFARLNRTEESDAKLEEMWENCRAYDRKWADHFRYRTPLLFLMFPGRFGQSMSGFFYRVSRKVVKFN